MTNHEAQQHDEVQPEGFHTIEAFKSAFREHPAGIAVVAAATDDGPVGITASSVASVGLDPLALAFSVTTSGGSAGHILAADTFMVHLLSARNVDAAKIFAGHSVERFTPDQGWETLATGEPYLPTARVALRCRPLSTTRVGESSLVLAEVLDVYPGEPGEPVVYFDRGFHELA